ncbi:Protoporphyrinogen oxidase [Caulifigura coniformis]|uniref:Coproporphyrinogen III oxidase n=1 Tax=Caulifigura coniformis TaxID=2527983 RepID=A0A517SGV6_9PLAN|nr:protoporphyrinogen oxidase [Caulifigura coniformis]QDT55350.1 Protoporphyrinogen oxidase [Caulifigura coniformis]
MPSSPADHPFRVAIVGAGFSGLSAAIRMIDLAAEAGRGLNLQVFEGFTAVGGLVATQRLGEYLVERGADSFITNKPGGVAMCRRLGLQDRLVSTDPRFRQSFILRHGRPTPTPAGFQLIAPTRIGPFLKSPLLSWRGKKRVLAETSIPQRMDDGEESVASFVRRRFGDESFERIVQPLVGGIYTGDLERLSLRATFPRFEQMEQQCGSVLKALRRQRTADTSGARYGLFVSLPGGMTELLEAMRGEVARSQKFVFGDRVERLRRGEAGQWEVTAGRQTHVFDAVVLALPAHGSAKLLDAVDATLAGHLNAIEYSSSAIVLSGHRLADVRHPLDGAGLVIPHVEQRRILAVSFASRKFSGRAPEGRVILRTFLGGALQSDALAADDDALKRVVLEELRSILGVEGRPDFCEVARYPSGIPQFVIGHRARVERIEAKTGELRGLSLAGNAYHGVGIPDAIQSGLSAAEKAWADVAGRVAGDRGSSVGGDTIATPPARGDDLAERTQQSAGLTL